MCVGFLRFLNTYIHKNAQTLASGSYRIWNQRWKFIQKQQWKEKYISVNQNKLFLMAPRSTNGIVFVWRDVLVKHCKIYLSIYLFCVFLYFKIISHFALWDGKKKQNIRNVVFWSYMLYVVTNVEGKGDKSSPVTSLSTHVTAIYHKTHSAILPVEKA